MVRRKSESFRLPSPLPRHRFRHCTLPPPSPPNHDRLWPASASVPRAFEVLRSAHQHVVVVVAVRLVVSDARVHRHRHSVVVAAGAGRQPGRCCGRWHDRRRGRHYCGHRHNVYCRCYRVHRRCHRVHCRCHRVHLHGRHSFHCGKHPRYCRHRGYRRQRHAAVWLRFTSTEANHSTAGSYRKIVLVTTFFFKIYDAI